MGRETYREFPKDDRVYVDRNEYFVFSFDERRTRYTSTMGCEARVLRVRGSFVDVFDGHDVYQVFIDTELVKEQKVLPGDFIQCAGVLTESSQGTQILAIHELVIDRRSNSPLSRNPSNPDLVPFIESIRDSKERATLIESHLIVRDVENFLDGKGFLKVTTSSFDRVDTGLGSKPFKIQDENLILRRDFDIATRAYLLCCPSVYQVGQVYRNEGKSTKNRNDFLLAQVFSHGKMTRGLELGVDLIGNAFTKIGKEIPNIENLDMVPFIRRYANTPVNSILTSMESGLLLSTGDVEQVRLMMREAKKNVSVPTVVTSSITRDTPFAVTNRENPNLTDDFRLIWKGRTILHGSQEIPTFTEQNERYRQLIGENYEHTLSEGELRYLELLKYGMQDYWGMSVSMDLLIQIVLDISDVRKLRPTIT